MDWVGQGQWRRSQEIFWQERESLSVGLCIRGTSSFKVRRHYMQIGSVRLIAQFLLYGCHVDSRIPETPPSDFPHSQA